MPDETEILSIYASCGEFAVPIRAWGLMLALAERYGWEPRGTTPPDDDAVWAGGWQGDPSQWDGRYLPSLGQHVTEEDSGAFAAALNRALPDIPDHDAVKDKSKETGIDWNWFIKSPDVAVTAFEAFCGTNKRTLRDFIAHCREEGGLWIW
jgi:hypothetical protein